MNNDDAIDGVLVQLPLPGHISGDSVINAINPGKDVDGFIPSLWVKWYWGQPTFLPATPYGIMLMLEYYKINTTGMNCVVIGRSNIVGTPITMVMSPQHQSR